MKTQPISSWGPRSVSYWLTAVVAAGIIFIGLRFMLAPQIGAAGYGISLGNTREVLAYGTIKGIRDIYSGIVILIFLILRKPLMTALVFGAAIIIPVCDFFTVLSVNGPEDLTHLLIHSLTAVYMLVTTVLLFNAASKH